MSSKMESFALNVLLRFEPAVAPYSEFFDALWGTRSDGGPDWVNTRLRLYIRRLRKRGYKIEVVYKVGYQLCLTRSTTPTPLPISSCPQRCETSNSPLNSPPSPLVGPPASVGTAGAE